MKGGEENMTGFVKSRKIYLELVVSWLRSEIAKLTHILETMEQTDNYQSEFINGSLKSAEVEMRRLRKFINVN